MTPEEDRVKRIIEDSAEYCPLLLEDYEFHEATGGQEDDSDTVEEAGAET